MRKFKGSFFYYIGKTLKQYPFRGANETWVRNRHAQLVTNGQYRFIALKVQEEDKDRNGNYEHELHFGW